MRSMASTVGCGFALLVLNCAAHRCLLAQDPEILVSVSSTTVPFAASFDIVVERSWHEDCQGSDIALDFLDDLVPKIVAESDQVIDSRRIKKKRIRCIALHAEEIKIPLMVLQAQRGRDAREQVAFSEPISIVVLSSLQAADDLSLELHSGLLTLPDKFWVSQGFTLLVIGLVVIVAFSIGWLRWSSSRLLDFSDPLQNAVDGWAQLMQDYAAGAVSDAEIADRTCAILRSYFVGRYGATMATAEFADFAKLSAQDIAWDEQSQALLAEFAELSRAQRFSGEPVSQSAAEQLMSLFDGLMTMVTTHIDEQDQAAATRISP